MGKDMVSQPIWIGIAIGVFFVGIGVSYAIFSDSPNSIMKFSNQQMFDQMMSQNPKMHAQWMGSMMNDPDLQQQMMQQMGTMMNDPVQRQQMIDMMMLNQEFMQDMMKNNQMMDMMRGMMGSGMQGQGGMMNSGMTGSSMMTNMPFNTNAPMTMPMIDGYYNGEKVYFVHTEVSDKAMAEMMTMMINFPTLHFSNLKNISPDEMAKVYVFTNGIAGSEPYGGGPFMYQIDVFDSIPNQIEYSPFRVPHLVTWGDNSTPRILTSVDEILEAETNGELTIQETDNVVNAPMVVWKSDGKDQRATIIPRMFESMPGVDGEVTNVDVDNYLVMFKMHSKNDMGMMGQGMMNP